MNAQVAVVTGANRDIGHAIAVASADAGYTVAASARDPGSLAGTIAEAKGSVVPFACDVRDEASAAALAAGAEELGPRRLPAQAPGRARRPDPRGGARRLARAATRDLTSSRPTGRRSRRCRPR